MGSDQNSISVIMPVFNGDPFLAEAVASIRRQSLQPMEIIIIDDGSTDRTSRYATSLGEDVYYFYQENGGPAVARNRALRIARGEIIAFLDADDVWPEDKLAIQSSCLAADPSLEIVTGNTQYLKYDGKDYKPYLQPTFNLHLGAGVFRRSVFEKVGEFNPSLHLSEDIDWFKRANALEIKIAKLETTTLYFRIHEKNLEQYRERHSLSGLQDFHSMQLITVSGNCS
ncbi:MAG: glycosyltransferase family 2 protein [Blastocatellia bacterium]|nr:glycosyltransferase family 2 protein [Blastocatellia bacterium]